MDIPTWLVEILRQFPMVVVIGFAVWYAEKRVREKEMRLEDRYDKNWKESADRESALRAEVRRDRDAEIQRLTDTHDEAAAVKDEQIAKLTEEVQDLRRQLATLTKKLQG